MQVSLVHDIAARLGRLWRRGRPVVTWVDANYGPATCVMLQSLYTNNPDTPFDTQIFTPPGETGVAQPRFAAAFDTLRLRFGRRIAVREIDDGLLRELSLSSLMHYLTHATYGNLLLGDLVVQTDIAPLLALDLGEALIAGAPDHGDSTNWRERLGIEHADTYVNNGVMLVNARAWRKEKVLSQVLDWHRRLGQRAAYLDQDLVNIVAIGRKKLLEPQWNVMQHALLAQNTLETIDPETFRGIFHLTWVPKPWSPDAPEKQRALYERYAKDAPLRM
jgi:hypothetical protein